MNTTDRATRQGHGEKTRSSPSSRALWAGRPRRALSYMGERQVPAAVALQAAHGPFGRRSGATPDRSVRQSRARPSSNGSFVRLAARPRPAPPDGAGGGAPGLRRQARRGAGYAALGTSIGARSFVLKVHFQVDLSREFAHDFVGLLIDLVP